MGYEEKVKKSCVKPRKFTLYSVLQITLMTLLRIPYLGRIGSTKLVLAKWHKYGILNRVIRVSDLNLFCQEIESDRFGDSLNSVLVYVTAP